MLSDILVTHHHHDHVGGVEQLKNVTGAKVYGPANENIPARDVALQDNDHITVLGWDFDVYAVPGHTLGHIAFYHQGVLLCGDTLFAAGCGRLFEGTPEQMHTSLDTPGRAARRYAGLLHPRIHTEQPQVRPAVEPHNADIAERVENVAANCATVARSRCRPTLALEKRTNPFLRTAETSVKQKADERNGRDNRSGAEVFASLRAWKDKF